MSVEKDVEKALTKAKGLTERLGELDKIQEEHTKQLKGQGESIKQIVMAVNGALGQQSRSLEEYKEMLNAVIGILGPQQVQAEIENARVMALQLQVEETKASIAKALEEGEVVRAEKASERSFVAGVETKPDGTAIPPGWAFVPMAKIEEEYRAQLVGQGVGFKITTKEGGFFELLEIYEAVEKPAEAPTTEAPPEAAPVQEKV